MYAYNQRTGTPVSQGYAPGYNVNPAFVPPPGIITGIVPNPGPAPGATPAPSQTLTPFHVAASRHTPTPPAPPPLNPVQVPPGCYPIELAQFWRDEYKRGVPLPLHWALFVRTAPPPTAGGSTRARAATGHNHARAQGPQGNFYELVGSSETYTAQFLAGTVAPETLPDWRGSHVIGWVHPAALGMFERAARQVQVWRRRPDWRCQQWVYEVMCALVGCEGAYVEGCSFERMYRQMGWLLEAWENGDI